MLSFSVVGDAAHGRWTEILSGLGIEASHLRDRHGPCPGCSGEDRFRFDNLEGRGTWICSQGGNGETAGDGFALLIHANIARDASEALTQVAQYLGIAPAAALSGVLSARLAR